MIKGEEFWNKKVPTFPPQYVIDREHIAVITETEKYTKISTFLLNAEIRQNIEREEVKNIRTNDGKEGVKSKPKKAPFKIVLATDTGCISLIFGVSNKTVIAFLHF